MLTLIRRYGVLILFFSMVGVAVAQTVTTGATVPVDWKVLIAAFVNSVLVLLVVSLINSYLPVLRERVPWLIPIVATGIGPVVGLAQTWFANQIGIQVDFSPILSAFAGAAATAIHQVGVNQPSVSKMMRRPSAR